MSELKERELHQIMVQRKNIAQVCRFAVKNLIDRSCFDTMGESSPEIVNFCNIMEHVLSHRLKPRTSWYSQDDRSYWYFIKTACMTVPHHCIASIRSMEHITTPRGKARAWLKVVLMEKRLSEYMSIALKQTKLIKAAYNEGALMLSDDAHILLGSLLGLNAIDFSFDLKGENVDVGGMPVIDYTPFLRFQQCPESIHSDTKELNELSNSNSTSSILSEDVVALDVESVKAKYLKLESKYKAVCEQKGYLEELVRLREDQLGDMTAQRTKLVDVLHNLETENKHDRRQLESVIIELQAQLAMAKQDQQKLTRQMKEYLGHSRTPPIIHEPSMEAIGYHIGQRSPLRTRAHGEADRLSTASNELSTAHAMADNRSILSDSRSLLSELSAAGALDETSSMIPMAGSFTSLNSTRSADMMKNNDPSKFKIDFVQSVPLVSSVDKKLLSPVAMAVLQSNASIDNENEDDEGVTYYTNHNEHKVCVTAEVHRADSLMSPVEEKTDLPGVPAVDAREGETVGAHDGDVDGEENMSAIVYDTPIGDKTEGPTTGETSGAHNGDVDNSKTEQNETGNDTKTSRQNQDELVDTDNSEQLMKNSVSDGSLPETCSSGANGSSQPDTGVTLGTGGMPRMDNFDKNITEEDLADQEALDEFSQVSDVINESLAVGPSGEGPGKTAEEDHEGVTDVQEGHNGEECFHVSGSHEDDDYDWD